MEGTATAAWIPYASATEGTRLRRKGFLNAVARSRVWSNVILCECLYRKDFTSSRVFSGKISTFTYTRDSRKGSPGSSLYAPSYPAVLTSKHSLRLSVRRIPLYQNVWRSRLVVGIDAVISRLPSTSNRGTKCKLPDYSA